MNVLSITGLGLDLIGVLMLGVDLVRVQHKLRGDAEERLSTLNEVTEAAGGVDNFLKSITGDWREYDYDEGAVFPRDGTFDYQAPKQSFSDMKDGINGLADNLHTVATMLVAGVENDRAMANMSLKVTFLGLALIVIGFLLQALAYI